jgi:hypothetical protein
MVRRARRAALLLAALVVVVARAPRAGAQAAPAGDCTYTRCALGIAPVWNGLALVRGAGNERVANLGFLWTGSLHAVFAGNDSATVYARRAVRTRRTAAVFTDGGALLLAAALYKRVSDGELTSSAKALAIAGGAAFAVSVPLQFRADGHLSRAVWWHNAQYSR